MVVVEGGNLLHHVKGGELPGRGKCPGGICPREMSGSHGCPGAALGWPSSVDQALTNKY